MKIYVLTLILLPLTLLAQDDIADIFNDLAAFEPATAAPAAPAAPTATAPATLTMPDPAPAPTPSPLTIQPPAQENPFIYTSGAPTPVMEPAPVNEIEVENYLSRGKEAYSDDDWNDAQQFFEAVLFTDPHNTTAIRWLQRIAKKKAGIEQKSYDTTRTRMLENVQAAWNTPKSKGKPVDSGAVEREPTVNELRAQALREKLAAIQIPMITFQNADIQQVVLELSALCRKLDGKGVNLVVFGTSETLLPPVTFSGTDLSALETLDIITQMSGMKYDIGPSMVSLTPVNYEPLQQMISAEFDLMPSVGSKLMLRSDSETATGMIDASGFFGSVPFPAGASALFNPEFNLLMVRNSPKHMDKVESLLARYNQKALDERSRQVEIETKFIEVAEGALEELGFEWTIGNYGEAITGDSITMAGGQLFTDTLRTGEEAFSTSVGASARATSFNSYAGAAAGSLDDGLIGGAGKLLIQKVSGVPVDLLIQALERQAGSDLLSAPKVLTKSGETATIHVGETHSFPTAYDVMIERYSQPSLIPLDYEEYKTGVMLEVTPELDPENGTIELELAPEIRELAGFDEQHVGTLWPLFSTGGTSANPFELIADTLTGDDIQDILGVEIGAADRLIARMPVFKTRKVETTVTIEDGSTIAMGGLIKEKLETFTDSVPFLGRIPLIGRLFRSEGEKSVKRNLIIFVTANQVDASGHRKAAE